MKNNEKKGERKIPKCSKTVTGKHMFPKNGEWVLQEGILPNYRCKLCGMIYDGKIISQEKTKWEKKLTSFFKKRHMDCSEYKTNTAKCKGCRFYNEVLWDLEVDYKELYYKILSLQRAEAYKEGEEHAYATVNALNKIAEDSTAVQWGTLKESIRKEARAELMREVEEACKEYDKKYERYPESEYEGYSVLRFIKEQLAKLKLSVNGLKV